MLKNIYMMYLILNTTSHNNFSMFSMFRNIKFVAAYALLYSLDNHIYYVFTCSYGMYGGMTMEAICMDHLHVDRNCMERLKRNNCGSYVWRGYKVMTMKRVMERLPRYDYTSITRRMEWLRRYDYKGRYGLATKVCLRGEVWRGYGGMTTGRTMERLPRCDYKANYGEATD